MRLPVTVFIFFFIKIHLSAQNIHVVDKFSQKPIQEVAVYSVSKKFSTLSNSLGLVALDNCSDKEILIFEHIGYEKLLLQKSELPVRISLVPKNHALPVVNFSEIKNDVILENGIVIEKKEIASLNPSQVNTVLERSLAMNIQKNQPGGGSPILRGMEANRLLIVLDDIPLNNAIYRSGHIQSLSLVDPFMLSNVSLLYGPASIIYGGGAMGGGVILNTIAPSFSTISKHTLAQHYETSSNSVISSYRSIYSFKNVASVSGISFFSHGDLEMGGKRAHHYPNWGAESHITSNNKQLGTAFYKGIITHKSLLKLGVSSSILIQTNYGKTSNINRFDKLNDVDDEKPKYKFWFYGPKEMFFQKIKFNALKKYTFSDEASVSISYQNLKESRHTQKSNSNSLSNRYENVIVYDIKTDFKKRFFNITFFYGVNSRYQNVTSTANILTNNVSLYNTTRYPDGGSNVSDYGVYSYFKTSLYKNLDLNFGSRFNYNLLSANFSDTTTYSLPFSKLTSVNKFLTSSVEIIWRLPKEFELSISSYRGFRNPNIDDVGKIFSKNGVSVIIPNNNLTTEKTLTFELGINKNVAEIYTLETSFFRNILTDAIVRRYAFVNSLDSILYDGELMRVEMNKNVTSAIISGFSSRLKIYINSKLKINNIINYVTSTYTSDGLPLAHIPPISINTFFEYEAKNWDVCLYLLYNGKKKLDSFDSSGIDNLDEATIRGLPSWYTINSSFGIKINDGIKLGIQIDNILDAHYKTFGSGLSASGRNIIVSLRSSF